MSSWTARVEWTMYVDLGEGNLVEIVERLRPFGGAVGMEKERAGRGNAEIWSAVLTVDAPTLRQAATKALQEVEHATGEKATGIEVLPTHEFDRRALEPSIPNLVGYAEIAEMAGVTRQRAREIAETTIGFPLAVVETKAGPLRVREQVERWIERWERKPGRPAKARPDS